jgi:hypothetical protein
VLIGILNFFTYEFKIVLALARYNYIAENFREIDNHFLESAVQNSLKTDIFKRLILKAPYGY